MTRRHDDYPFQFARPLLAILLTLVLLCLAPPAADAKTFKLGADQPVVELAMPPDWETTAADTGVEATAPGVYLSAELIDAEDLAEATNASAQFLAERKIKLDTATKTQKVITVAGLPATQNDWDGADPDGPTRVRIWIVRVTKDKLLVIFYWRSPAADKARAPEVEFIVNSIKPIK